VCTERRKISKAGHGVTYKRIYSSESSGKEIVNEIVVGGVQQTRVGKENRNTLLNTCEKIYRTLTVIGTEMMGL
jgi:hypothetical protein